MGAIEQILGKYGPARSSRIAQMLQEEFKLTPVAARKRISRVVQPIRRFPLPLLPKREAFLYRQDQRNTERFWTNLIRELRETNSVYGAALDGLMARGGIVAAEEFAVISGAPLALKGQISSSRVGDTLVGAGAISRDNLADLGDCYRCVRSEIGSADSSGFRPRLTAEGVILDGVREWARKLGLGSYNSIAIRGEDKPRQVGQFKWDLTGPSYLLPLRRGQAKNGFLVADVFSDGILDEHSIEFFIRKVQMLRASSNSGDTLAILVAPGFTGTALTRGHSAGVVLATPENLFGHKVGAAIQSLIVTLKNAAAVASANPEKLASLIDDLSEIEGAAGNLRGVLFELIAAYLARLDAVSVDVGITARDPDTGKMADIDVLKVRNKSECIGIECKGKQPGGVVTDEEIADWLRRIPTFRAHLVGEKRFREAKIGFEIWTTGTFTADALALLEAEKPKRTKTPIDWKDGSQVADIARTSKEKAIREALYEHFLRHPLSSTLESGTKTT
jgi:hypothetical protein